MRYFIVRYVTRADGRIDELSEVRNSIKTSHLQSSAVILDFKRLQVVQAHVNGVNAGRDWNKLIETYTPHYQQYFAMLLDHNHPQEPAKEDWDQEPS